MKYEWQFSDETQLFMAQEQLLQMMLTHWSITEVQWWLTCFHLDSINVFVVFLIGVTNFQ